jgi:hypothetical protein
MIIFDPITDLNYAIERMKGKTVNIEVKYKTKKPDPFKWSPLKDAQ